MEEEKLIWEWKNLRSMYFNRLSEDEKKFEKLYSSNPLYPSVVKHFDKTFKEINQIAQIEVMEYLKQKT